jgi:hypothetical protein
MKCICVQTLPKIRPEHLQKTSGWDFPPLQTSPAMRTLSFEREGLMTTSVTDLAYVFWRKISFKYEFVNNQRKCMDVVKMFWQFWRRILCGMEPRTTRRAQDRQNDTYTVSGASAPAAPPWSLLESFWEQALELTQNCRVYLRVCLTQSRSQRTGKCVLRLASIRNLEFMYIDMILNWHLRRKFSRLISHDQIWKWHVFQEFPGLNLCHVHDLLTGGSFPASPQPFAYNVLYSSIETVVWTLYRDIPKFFFS